MNFHSGGGGLDLEGSNGLDLETRARWPANVDGDATLLIALILVTDPHSDI